MCHKNDLHLFVLHFPPLFIKTIHGGGDTDWLQTLVSVTLCYSQGRDTAAVGVGMVDAVGVALQLLLALHQ